MTLRKTIEVVTKLADQGSEQRDYPDIGDILARKARGRRELARLSFGEKLDILEKLREQVAPIVRARRLRHPQKPSGTD
jgi:hypothetical protein